MNKTILFIHKDDTFTYKLFNTRIEAETEIMGHAASGNYSITYTPVYVRAKIDKTLYLCISEENAFKDGDYIELFVNPILPVQIEYTSGRSDERKRALDKLKIAGDAVFSREEVLGAETAEDELAKCELINYAPLDMHPDEIAKLNITNPAAAGHSLIQSAYIESILLGLPTAPIYIDEQRNVIDGRQRTAAIQRFLNGELTLAALSRLSRLNGLKYSMLPSGVRKAFDKRLIRVYLFLKTNDANNKEIAKIINRKGGAV